MQRLLHQTAQASFKLATACGSSGSFGKQAQAHVSAVAEAIPAALRPDRRSMSASPSSDGAGRGAAPSWMRVSSSESELRVPSSDSDAPSASLSELAEPATAPIKL